jgi:hypothetical protein
MTPHIQLRRDKTRRRQLEAFLVRYGLEDVELRELAGIQRRIVWLERQTAPETDWRLEMRL